jgi:guanylate kinase
MPTGTYVIVTGPSGAGKTTVVDQLLSRFPSSCRIVTTTTRPPRPGEVDGRDYHFLSRPDFERRREAGEFLEWDEHYGNLYGSTRSEVDRLVARHPVVFGVVDVNGAVSTKKVMPSCVVVFIDVEDLEQVRRRLSGRKGMTPEQLEKRVAAASKERSLAGMFDRVIVNRDGKLEETLEKCSDLVSGLMLSGRVK